LALRPHKAVKVAMLDGPVRIVGWVAVVEPLRTGLRIKDIAIRIVCPGGDGCVAQGVGEHIQSTFCKNSLAKGDFLARSVLRFAHYSTTRSGASVAPSGIGAGGGGGAARSYSATASASGMGAGGGGGAASSVAPLSSGAAA